MKTLSHAQMNEGFYDLLGTEKSKLNEVKLTDTANTLEQLAAMYAGLIREKADKADAASSGSMVDSINPTEIEYNGSIISIGVEAKDYMSYVDEGVNGWANSRGSVYSFRTKGVGDTMLQSIKEYLKNEGNAARNVKVGISAREKNGIDALTRNAKAVGFMIKRMGIKPKYFFRDATKEMEIVIRNELGAALKIDIINNFTK